MKIKVIIEKGEDGFYVARVPALKGCWSQGKTRDQALENVREAIDLYLEPEPSVSAVTNGREVVEPFGMKLPIFSGKQVVRALERLGFDEISRKGGL